MMYFHVHSVTMEILSSQLPRTTHVESGDKKKFSIYIWSSVACCIMVFIVLNVSSHNMLHITKLFDTHAQSSVESFNNQAVIYVKIESYMFVVFPSFHTL